MFAGLVLDSYVAEGKALPSTLAALGGNGVLFGTRSAARVRQYMGGMRHGLVSTTLLTLLLNAAWSLAAPGPAANPVPEQDSRHSKSRSTSSASMTGCMDEQDGRYVLVDERTLSPVADLVAEGFPTEGFAKHMGHKVTVRGTPSSGGTRPVFRVRSIETVSDTCAPQTSVEQGMN